MRRTCSLFLALGLAWCHAGTAWAQTSDTTPFQRLSGLFTPKGKGDVGKRETAPPPLNVSPLNPQQPRPTQSAVTTPPRAIAPPAVGGAYESRGIVYVEEPGAPVALPKTTVAAPLPKGPPTLPQAPLRTTSAPVANVPAPPSINTPAPKTATPAPSDALARRLAAQVSQACPQARNVKVAFGNDKELTVEMDVRSMDDCNALAGSVFAIRDLDAYRVNLKFNVPQQ